MAIEKMLFNGKQYFEGQMPCYIGKHIINLDKLMQPYEMDSYGTIREWSGSKLRNPNNCQIDAQVVDPAGGSRSIWVRLFRSEWFCIDDIFQNGGVSASLNHGLLLRKEFSVIKEILFNKQKYWQAEDEPLIGKEIKTTDKEISTWDNLYVDILTFLQGKTTYRKPSGAIIGYVKGTDGQTMICTSHSGWFKLNDLIQNGGVLPSLYTKLCNTFKKAVILC